VHKKLGQVGPAAATNTKAYQVAGTVDAAIITSLLASNHGSAEDTIRVFSVSAGDTAGLGNDVYYDIPVPSGDCFLSNPATVLQPSGALWVYSLNGTTSFTVSGLEIS